MPVFKHKIHLKEFYFENNLQSHAIGFVPTMGSLHKGHLTLVKKALEEHKWVVVSIFINPTQFNNPNDLKNYPRDFKSDLSKLSTLSQNLIVYVPDTQDIYPYGATIKHFDFGNIDKILEGVSRKNHFNGVATVISLLFEIVNPSVAYFGEKDFQQCLIIKKLAETKRLSIKIETCPIVRTSDGLAYSSRNKLLSKTGLNKACYLYQVLQNVKNMQIERSVTEVINWGRKQFANNLDFELDYFEIVDENTLTPIKNWQTKNCRVFVAAHIEGIRLIDNIKIN